MSRKRELLSAISGAVFLSAVTPLLGIGGPESTRQCWWFPSNLPTGTKYHYLAVLKAENTYRGETTQVHEQVDFAVSVLPTARGKPGCMVRMLPPDPSPGASDGLAQLWIERLAEGNPDGVWATADAIFVHDVPLLRGPWHKGDHFSVFGFGAWLVPLLGSGYVVGTLHFDVYSATPTNANLRFDFWAGQAVPALRGKGNLFFESDAEGVAMIRADWTRTLGEEKREAVLTVSRVSIDKSQGDAATATGPTSQPWRQTARPHDRSSPRTTRIFRARVLSVSLLSRYEGRAKLAGMDPRFLLMLEVLGGRDTSSYEKGAILRYAIHSVALLFQTADNVVGKEFTFREDVRELDDTVIHRLSLVSE